MHACPNKLNEVLGGIMPVSNATLATVDIRNRAAELGASVASTAHSRGTLTEALATQYQLRNGQGQLYQSTHTSDPVGTLIGGNEPTGGMPWSNPIEAHVQYGPNPNKPEDQLKVWDQTNIDAVLVAPSSAPSALEVAPQEVRP